MNDKITIDRALLQQALDALKSCSAVPNWPVFAPIRNALREALAAPQRQPRPFRECEDSQPAPQQEEPECEHGMPLRIGCDDCTIARLDAENKALKAAQPLAPLEVIARLGFKLALDGDLRRRADKIAGQLKGGRVNYAVEQAAATLIWEMRDALAAPQPAQPAEPVAWMHRLDWIGERRGIFTGSFDLPPGFGIPLYEAPPPAQQPLTESQYIAALGPLRDEIVCSAGTLRKIVRAIEAARGIGSEP